MAVTLQNIADRLGISVQAVSMALNQRPGTARVSPALRERVVQAAREMGYRPNKLARGLALGRSRTLGLLLLDDHYSLFAPAYREAEAAAAAAGFGLFLCTSYPLPDGQRHHLDFFAESRVEGIVSVAPSRIGYADEILAAKPSGTPLVSINREVSHPEVHSILMDLRGAGRQATEHLLTQGRRRVVYLDIPTSPALQASVDLRSGYLDAMEAAGLPARVASLHSGWVERLADARACTHSLLDEAEPPEAIVAVTDYEAVAALQACLERGLRVPDDVAIFGCDDMDIAAYASIPISTIQQPFGDAGRLAVARILEWGADAGGACTRLDCCLVLRASTGADTPQ